MKQRLFTPGPTPVPERVMLRMAEPLIHHRSKEFRDLFARVNENLAYLFLTHTPPLVVTASGTGGMEALIINLLSPGEEYVYGNGGKFGERWGTIGSAYGMKPVEITAPWGTAVTPEMVNASLDAHPNARAVCLTHSETSTGVYTDIQAIASAVHRRTDADRLVIVDGITSIGAHEVRFDEWGIDAMVTGSQKGLMIPPGLAFCALSQKAWQAAETSTTPKFYFDLREARRTLAVGDTPWTPAVTLIIGLDEALRMIREEGIEAIWARHARLARAVRAGCVALGMRIFGHPPSNALTAVWLPDGVQGTKFTDTLKYKYGVTTAGGQGSFKGRIFRLSHLGYYDEADITSLFTCIELALRDCGYPFEPGAGVAAAHRVIIHDTPI
jgi:aspartate aminotransferase-like enzyme